MKNSSPDFPPLTKRQIDLLEEIKAEKEKLKTLPPWDPKAGTSVPELSEIQKRIDELSVKALRSGLLKNLPKESRHPGFRFVFDSSGEHAEVLPGFGVFHPDLPLWAKNHFIDWIRMLRAGLRRYDARDVLRETGIVGIETGMKNSLDLANVEHDELIRRRVLELRGVEGEEKKTGNKRKRTRKISATWDKVIDKW